MRNLMRFSGGQGAGVQDGRYLVVVQAGKMVLVRQLDGHHMVDGADAQNLTTFLSEFVPEGMLRLALSVICHRLCQVTDQTDRKEVGR